MYFSIKKILIISLLIFCLNSLVYADDYVPKPGIDFFPMKDPVNPSSELKDKMDVIFFFNYSSLKDFSDVDLAFFNWASKVPASINPVYAIANTGKTTDLYDAFLFFGLSKENKESDLHESLIKDISSGLRYTDLNNVLFPWLSNHGVNVNEFKNDVGDSITKNLVLRTSDITEEYQVKTIPSVVVDGKIVIPYNKDMTPSQFITLINSVITYLWNEEKNNESTDNAVHI